MNPPTATRERDYVAVVKKFGTQSYFVGPTREQRFRDTCHQRTPPYRYLDTLTKKQRHALNVLRIAPVDTYIEGIGIAFKYRRGTWNPEKNQHDWGEQIYYYIDAIVTGKGE